MVARSTDASGARRLDGSLEPGNDGSYSPWAGRTGSTALNMSHTMEDVSFRDDFLDRMVSICRLLGIEAPPDLEGDVVAYQLDIDEISFVLTHSIIDKPDSLLAECALGKLPTADREASLTYLLQTSASLGQRGLGALGLDPAGEAASCLTRMDLHHTDQAVLATLLDVREVARAWGRRFWPSATEQSTQSLIRP